MLHKNIIIYILITKGQIQQYFGASESRSELIPIVFNMELFHLGSEASILGIITENINIID